MVQVTLCASSLGYLFPQNETQDLRLHSAFKRKKVCRTATKFLHSAGGVMTNVKGVKEWHTATNFLMLYGFEIKKIVEIV